MLNCVVCDDDLSVTSEIKEILTDILRQKALVHEIATYTDSRMLLYDIMEDFAPDLAILDIEMPHYNGMQLASEIKKKHPKCCIIFLTQYQQYAADAYEYDIFRYLSKSQIKNKFSQYVTDAVKVLSMQDEMFFTLASKELFERIPYSVLSSVVKDGKYCIIKCTNGRHIRVRSSLCDIERELDPREFVKIERSTIVNVSMIMRITDSELVCMDGSAFPLSKAKAREAKSKVALYFGKIL